MTFNFSMTINVFMTKKKGTGLMTKAAVFMNQLAKL